MAGKLTQAQHVLDIRFTHTAINNCRDRRHSSYCCRARALTVCCEGGMCKLWTAMGRQKWCADVVCAYCVYMHVPGV
jgi:hypothetical protein